MESPGLGFSHGLAPAPSYLSEGQLSQNCRPESAWPSRAWAPSPPASPALFPAPCASFIRAPPRGRHGRPELSRRLWLAGQCQADALRPVLLTPQIRNRAQHSEVTEPRPHSRLVTEPDCGPVRFWRASAGSPPTAGGSYTLPRPPSEERCASPCCRRSEQHRGAGGQARLGSLATQGVREVAVTRCRSLPQDFWLPRASGVRLRIPQSGRSAPTAVPGAAAPDPGARGLPLILARGFASPAVGGAGASGWELGRAASGAERAVRGPVSCPRGPACLCVCPPTRPRGPGPGTSCQPGRLGESEAEDVAL